MAKLPSDIRMKDTAYFVPPAKIERLAHAYRGEGDRLVLFDEPATGKWSRPPTFEHGAAALSGLKIAREAHAKRERRLARRTGSERFATVSRGES